MGHFTRTLFNQEDIRKAGNPITDYGNKSWHSAMSVFMKSDITFNSMILR